VGDICHVFVIELTNKINLYLGDTCQVFVNEITNKINMYSNATWLFIVTDFLTDVDHVYVLIACQIGLPPMFIGTN
jgi:hypothetical protein